MPFFARLSLIALLAASTAPAVRAEAATDSATETPAAKDSAEVLPAITVSTVAGR